jgi:hypothetical protein
MLPRNLYYLVVFISDTVPAVWEEKPLQRGFRTRQLAIPKLLFTYVSKFRTICMAMATVDYRRP